MTYSEDRARRKQSSSAKSWRSDPRMELLATMKEKNPDRYDKVPALQKVALGYYLSARADAAAEGVGPKDSA